MRPQRLDTLSNSVEVTAEPDQPVDAPVVAAGIHTSVSEPIPIRNARTQAKIKLKVKSGCEYNCIETKFYAFLVTKTLSLSTPTPVTHEIVFSVTCLDPWALQAFLYPLSCLSPLQLLPVK